MASSQAQLRLWLQDLSAPVVMVAATPAAEASIAGRNGLSLVDLLRPYSALSNLNGATLVGSQCHGALALQHTATAAGWQACVGVMHVPVPGSNSLPEVGTRAPCPP